MDPLQLANVLDPSTSFWTPFRQDAIPGSASVMAFNIINPPGSGSHSTSTNLFYGIAHNGERALHGITNEVMRVSRGMSGYVPIPADKKKKKGDMASLEDADNDAGMSAEERAELASADNLGDENNGNYAHSRIQRFDEDLFDDNHAVIGTRVWVVVDRARPGPSVSNIVDRIISANVAQLKSVKNKKLYCKFDNVSDNVNAMPTFRAHRSIRTASDWIHDIFTRLDGTVPEFRDHIYNNQGGLSENFSFDTAPADLTFEKIVSAQRIVQYTPHIVCAQQRDVNTYFGGDAALEFPHPNRVMETNLQKIDASSIDRIPLAGTLRQVMAHEYMRNMRILSARFDLRDENRVNHIANQIVKVASNQVDAVSMAKKTELPSTFPTVVLPETWKFPQAQSDRQRSDSNDEMDDMGMFGGGGDDDSDLDGNDSDDSMLAEAADEFLGNIIEDEPVGAGGANLNNAQEFSEFHGLGVHDIEELPDGAQYGKTQFIVPESNSKPPEDIFFERSVLLEHRKQNRAQITDIYNLPDDGTDFKRRSAYDARKEALLKAYNAFMTDPERIDMSHRSVRKHIADQDNAGTLWPRERRLRNTNVSLFGNMLLEMQCRFHDLFNAAEYRHGNVMRVFWIHFTALRYDWDLSPNVMLTGSAASGKSWTFGCVESMSHPSLMQSGVHETNKAYTTDTDQNYVCVWFDEIPVQYLGVDSQGRKVPEDTILKSRLTAQYTISRRFIRDEETNKSQMIVEVCRCMGTVMGCNNSAIYDESSPMQSRFMHLYSFVQKGAIFADTPSDSKQGAAPSTTAANSEMCREERNVHCLIALTERMIEAGALADVEMAAYRIVMQIFEQFLTDKYHMEHFSERVRQMVSSVCRSCVIYYAWHAGVFSEIGRTVRVLPNGKPTRLSAVICDVLLDRVQPRLVCTQEIAIYMLTLFQEMWISNVDLRFMAAVCKHFNYKPGSPESRPTDLKMYGYALDSRDGDDGDAGQHGNMEKTRVDRANETRDFRFFRMAGSAMDVAKLIHEEIKQNGGGYSPEAMIKTLNKFKNTYMKMRAVRMVEVNNRVSFQIADEPDNQPVKALHVMGRRGAEQRCVLISVELLDLHFEEAATQALRYINHKYNKNTKTYTMTGMPMVVPSKILPPQQPGGVGKRIPEMITTRFPRPVKGYKVEGRTHVITVSHQAMKLTDMFNADDDDIDDAFKTSGDTLLLTDDIDDFAFKTFFQGSLMYPPSSNEWRRVLPKNDLRLCRIAFSRDRARSIKRSLKKFPEDYYSRIYNEYRRYQRAKFIRRQNIQSMQASEEEEFANNGGGGDDENDQNDNLALAMNDVGVLNNIEDSQYDLDADQMAMMSTTRHLLQKTIQNNRVRPLSELGDLPMPSINKQPRHNNSAASVQEDMEAGFNDMDFLADFGDF